MTQEATLNIQFRDRRPVVIRTTTRGSTEAERTHTETLLGRYPELDRSEIDELKSWFDRRATAADVAMLACNERLYPHYRAFRRLQIDPFTALQKAVVALLTILPVALLAAALMADA